MKKQAILVLGLATFALAACGENTPASTNATHTTITVTDGIGRTLNVTPGSYKKIACVGAGALRTYSYIGDLDLLCGVEDIDNPAARTSSSPFGGVGRPYYDAFQEKFRGLPFAGKGGPMGMQAGVPLTELTALQPDLIVSDYETADDAVKMEEATGAVFDIMKKSLLTQLPVAILRGSAKNPLFYGGLLEELNKYLARCGVYTLMPSSKAYFNDDDCHFMEIQPLPTKNRGDDKRVEAIERLPYCLDYIDEDEDRQVCQLDGQMTVYRFEA